MVGKFFGIVIFGVCARVNHLQTMIAEQQLETFLNFSSSSSRLGFPRLWNRKDTFMFGFLENSCCFFSRGIYNFCFAWKIGTLLPKLGN
jgi:hypothetical protein